MVVERGFEEKIIMKILLFIPVYNCEKQIPRVLISLKKNWLNLIEEILIIDNRSSDNTILKVKEYMEKLSLRKIKILKNKKNINLGGSHKVAFKYANDNNFDKILILHGDNQADINDISNILNEFKRNYNLSYLGSRFMKGSKLKNYNKLRILGNIFFNFIFSLISKNKICDLGSGLNIFDVKSFNYHFLKNMPNDLTFNYVLILYISKYNIPHKFFPISWKEEDQISNMRALSQIKKMIFIILKFIFLQKKIFSDKNNNDEYKFDII